MNESLNFTRRWMAQDELRRIRESVSDASRVLDALGVRVSHEDKTHIWCFSPFREEKTPSFHIRKSDLVWYDFGEGEGHDWLNLVKKCKGLSDIFAAGQWALDSGLCSPAPRVATSASDMKEKKQGPKERNEPISDRYDLTRYMETEHPEFERRGISPATCRLMRFGYLPEDSKSILRGRIIFQIRRVEDIDGKLKSVLLGHVSHKSVSYTGLKKNELFNLDRVVLDAVARKQAEKFGLIIVEGGLDAAKLAEAGVFNVAATLTNKFVENQPGELRRVVSLMSIPRLLLWFDRDDAGRDGTKKTFEVLKETGVEIPVGTFDWNMKFADPRGEFISIPENLKDACDFSVKQLRFLRSFGKI